MFGQFLYTEPKKDGSKVEQEEEEEEEESSSELALPRPNPKQVIFLVADTGEFVPLGSEVVNTLGLKGDSGERASRFDLEFAVRNFTEAWDNDDDLSDCTRFEAE